MMSLDILKAVAGELDKSLRGGFINKIHQPLPREVALKVRVKGSAESKVVVSADPKFGRIHLTRLKIPNPQSPPRFCAFLRAHLQGAVIDSVSVAEDDRIVTIKCFKRFAQSIVTRLFVLELLGRDSNILLVDGESNKIMDCLFSIPAKETATRLIFPGIQYSLPPKKERQSSAADFAEASSVVRPSIVRRADGALDLAIHPRSDGDETFATMNQAADAFYSPVISRMITDAVRRAYMAPLKTRIASLTRRIGKIDRDRQRLEKLAAGLEMGELLKANIHKVTKGMDYVEVRDWVGQETIRIKLDPALDVIANMQRIFTKASKGKRGEAMVRKRMVDTLAERRALEDLLFLLEEAKTLEEVAAIVEGETISRQQGSALGNKRQFMPDKNNKCASGYRQFSTDSGLPILVGKTAQGNDLIRRSKAHEEDLWFHVKDAPGAHVIMRMEPGTVVMPQDIEKAAVLAGYFSRLRSSGKAEIMMTQVKNVRSIKGTTPGKVTVTNYKTLTVKWYNMDFELER